MKGLNATADETLMRGENGEDFTFRVAGGESDFLKLNISPEEPKLPMKFHKRLKKFYGRVFHADTAMP